MARNFKTNNRVSEDERIISCQPIGYVLLPEEAGLPTFSFAFILLSPHCLYFLEVCDRFGF
jgi:hypothetical protein